MPETTVPVSQDTEVRIAHIVERTGLSAADVVREAIEAYEARLFFSEMDDTYAVLEADFREWSSYMSDLNEWIDAGEPQSGEG